MIGGKISDGIFNKIDKYVDIIGNGGSSSTYVQPEPESLISDMLILAVVIIIVALVAILITVIILKKKKAENN